MYLYMETNTRLRDHGTLNLRRAIPNATGQPGRN